MEKWKNVLRHDPMPALFSAGNEALEYFTVRDLLAQDPGPVQMLWTHDEVVRITKRQNENGSWPYSSSRANAYDENYDLLETYRMLGVLIAKYGLDHTHSSISRAAEYVFSCQSGAGDIRGIFANQYAPHYTAGLLEWLITAGFEDHPAVEKGLSWLLSIRQEDGGWAWPIHAAGIRYEEAVTMETPVEGNRAAPFSHALTDFLLRVFAAHPRYRTRDEVKTAADLLKSRFFRADQYPDRGAAAYWTKYQYPFWWGNLLSALNSLSVLDVPLDDRKVREGLQWFIDHQDRDGLWPTSYAKGKSAIENRPWVALAICRMMKRFFQKGDRGLRVV